MKAILCLSAVVLALVCVVESTGYTKQSKQFRRNADDIRRYHRQNKLIGRNYVIGYPEEPLMTVVKLGTPGQDYWLNEESGIDNMWVFGVNFDGKKQQMGPGDARYDPANSTTANGPNELFEAYSGSFTVSGFSYTDVLTTFFENNNQSFGVVDTTDNTPVGFEFPFDGVYGTAWNPELANETVNEHSAPILNLFESFKTLPRFFTTRMDSGVMDGGRWSYATTGYGWGLDGTCEQNFTYTPLTYAFNQYSVPSMAFNLSSFAFGDYTDDKPTVAKVDSGLTTIMLPYAAFKSVMNTINPEYNWDLGIYTTDCENAGKFDDWQFTIGGSTFVVPSTRYIVDLAIGDGKCAVAFDLSSPFTPGYALGSPFLREYCHQFDIDNSRIGFSKPIPLEIPTTTEANTV